MLTAPEIKVLSVPAAPPLTVQHSITYYQWGDISASRLVVCVHGLTRNGRDFDFLARHLANEGYCVICPDMMGRGKSQWLENPAGYNYPAYVSDMLFLLESVDAKKVDWIGTSMGGIIGMMMVNAMPGLMRSLTLNDVGTIVSATGLRRISAYVGHNEGHNTWDDARESFRKRISPYGITEDHHWQHMCEHGLQQDKDGCIRLTYDPAIMQGFPKEDEIADINLSALWPAILPIPVLLIRGMESDLLTHETALAMKAQHPCLTLEEIAGVGHAPALMDANQIAIISKWLSTT